MAARVSAETFISWRINHHWGLLILHADKRIFPTHVGVNQNRERGIMERYTIKDAEKALDRLLVAIGGHRAKDYKDVGGYQLDYNTFYGGIRVDRIVNEAGGVTNPFGMHRVKPYDFCQMVDFTIKAIELKR